MHKYNVEGIILKNINYKDADKIFTIYSREKGKFTAIASGVRKMTSKRKGVLDSLNHVQFSLNKSSNRPTYISEVVLINSFSTLKSDLEYSVKGYYVLELIHRFIEDEEANPKIFDFVIKTLRLLDEKRLNPEIALSYFELSLMKHLGYALRFNSCVSCNKLFDEDWSNFKINLGLGGLVCDSCQNGFNIPAKDAHFLNGIERGVLVKDASVTGETLHLLRSFVQNVLEDSFRTAKVFGKI